MIDVARASNKLSNSQASINENTTTSEGRREQKKIIIFDCFGFN